MSHRPQNGDEAALVSFALVKSLIAALAAKGVLDRADIVGIAEAAVSLIDDGQPLVEQSGNGEAARAANFIRRTMFVGGDLG